MHLWDYLLKIVSPIHYKTLIYFHIGTLALHPNFFQRNIKKFRIF